MGCMADYDEDCKGKAPKGCMCVKCCEKHATINGKKLIHDGNGRILVHDAGESKIDNSILAKQIFILCRELDKTTLKDISKFNRIESLLDDFEQAIERDVKTKIGTDLICH